MTGKPVNVTTDYNEKRLQRALLQYSKPENQNLVREALALAGREDLIGHSAECLVRPAFGKGVPSMYDPKRKKSVKPTQRGKTDGRGAKNKARSESGVRAAGGKPQRAPKASSLKRGVSSRIGGAAMAKKTVKTASKKHR